jgi:hypothetical protein
MLLSGARSQRRGIGTTRFRSSARTLSSARVKRASAPSRPPHPASHVRDDRDTPLLVEAGRRGDKHRFPKNEMEYFSRRGLTLPGLIFCLGEVSCSSGNRVLTGRPRRSPTSQSNNRPNSTLPSTCMPKRWASPCGRCRQGDRPISGSDPELNSGLGRSFVLRACAQLRKKFPP